MAKKWAKSVFPIIWTRNKCYKKSGYLRSLNTFYGKFKYLVRNIKKLHFATNVTNG